MGESLGASLAQRNNALNFMRLCLASAVIAGHTIPIAGYDVGWYEVFRGWSGWAVNGFFAISGYLIAGSRVRTGWWGYLWRRSLRILPAFWVNLLVTAFVFAPVAATIQGGGYELIDGWRYVAMNWGLRIREWNVGSTLAAVPYPDVWNGSLWTLFYEFSAYILAGLLLFVPTIRRHGIFAFGALTVVAMIGLPLARGPLDVTTNLYLNGLRLAGFFLAGMFVFFLRDRISTTWWVGAASFAATGTLAAFGLAPAWGQIPYAVLLLWLGAVLPIRLGSTNDISYGVYIYAMPVQQILAIWAGDRVPFVVTCLVALAMTVPWAVASWLLVEKPVMRLRTLVPSARANRPLGRASHGRMAMPENGLRRSHGTNLVVPRGDASVGPDREIRS